MADEGYFLISTCYDGKMIRTRVPDKKETSGNATITRAIASHQRKVLEYLDITESRRLSPFPVWEQEPQGRRSGVNVRRWRG